MKLTAHFTSDEFTRSVVAKSLGIDNSIPEDLMQNVRITANLLERIRSMTRKPIIITSGYRCPRLNSVVGSFTTSDHLTGQAADIVCPEFGTPSALAKYLSTLVDALNIGQLILEGVKGKQWCHISTRQVARPINRVITITDKGTFPGIVVLA